MNERWQLREIDQRLARADEVIARTNFILEHLDMTPNECLAAYEATRPVAQPLGAVALSRVPTLPTSR
jgi:hypothetical protein